MNIKATVLLLAVLAVCTVIQARMTMRRSDSDENDDPSNNDRSETRDGYNDRDDRSTRNPSDGQGRSPNDRDDDRYDRSTRNPSDGQGRWPNDRDDDRYDRSTRNPSDGQGRSQNDRDDDKYDRSTRNPSDGQGRWPNDRYDRSTRNPSDGQGRSQNDRDDDRYDHSTRNPSDGQGHSSNDRDDDRYDRSTRNPSDGQGHSSNDRNDDRYTRSTRNPLDRQDGSGGDDGQRARTSTSSYPMYTQKKPCFMVDLAFAVDSSGSISGENWTRVTDFFNRVIARMEVNPDCARVSIVTFGSMASLQFDLLVYTDAASLRRGIERLHTHNQTRDFVGAIRQVRSEVFQDYYGDRQGIPNVCVLLTDGNSGADRKYTLAEAARAKSDGISMHAIGIGRYVLMSELSLIADRPASAVHLNDFSDLKGEAAMRALFAYMEGFRKSTVPNSKSTTPVSWLSSTRTARQTTRTTPRTTTTSTTEEPTKTTPTVVPNVDWQCSFEDATGQGSLCDMTQSSFDDFDWTLGSGGTPSSETGPNSAYGGSGYYVFIEASSPRRKNDKAMLLLPSFIRDGVYCLSFYYNMNGFHVNKLRVVKRATSGQLVDVWVKKHNQGRQWHSVHVTADLSSSQQLAFIGVRGDAFSGDIAIDNVSVKYGRCNADDEAGRHS